MYCLFILFRAIDLCYPKGGAIRKTDSDSAISKISLQHKGVFDRIKLPIGRSEINTYTKHDVLHLLIVPVNPGPMRMICCNRRKNCMETT